MLLVCMMATTTTTPYHGKARHTEAQLAHGQLKSSVEAAAMQCSLQARQGGAIEKTPFRKAVEVEVQASSKHLLTERDDRLLEVGILAI